MSIFGAAGASEACDQVNDKDGKYVITPALMMGMDSLILDGISLGGVKALEGWYTGKA